MKYLLVAMLLSLTCEISTPSETTNELLDAQYQNNQLISAGTYPAEDEVYTFVFLANGVAFRLVMTSGAFEARDGWQLEINDDSRSFDLWSPNRTIVFRRLIVLAGDMWDIQVLNYDVIVENDLTLEIYPGEVLWVEINPQQAPPRRESRYA